MSKESISKDQVYVQLKKCMDPEIPINVVDLGLIYGVEIEAEKDVNIKMTMTTRGCPLHNTMVNDVKKHVGKIKGIGNINVEIVWDPPWSIDKMDPSARDSIGFGKPKLRFQIDYEKAHPKQIGSYMKSEDGSLILMNKDEKSFMVNDAIVRFWESCDGTKTINQLTDYFSEKLGIPRQQVEQETVQLLEQLFDAKLIEV
ncbi:MAG TPA: PqqD family peptide modification chaperone [Nitrososphaeraceae archaeon]|jgi:metal-sulfur cluster biosynthetic enzyme|nr:PqqD family peptide modification chaperone [Nitrososphaeraceae archaeon]